MKILTFLSTQIFVYKCSCGVILYSAKPFQIETVLFNGSVLIHGIVHAYHVKHSASIRFQ